MELINYHFDKPWYKQSELIIKLGMSNICLKRYMSEQLKAGKELSAMGYLKFKGFKEPCWEPHKLIAWLIENKLEPEAKYDYELADQSRIIMSIVNFNKAKAKKEAINE